MVKITVDISNDIDTKFRGAVFKAKGFHKGMMREAINEALEQWSDKILKSKAS